MGALFWMVTASFVTLLLIAYGFAQSTGVAR